MMASKRFEIGDLVWVGNVGSCFYGRTGKVVNFFRNTHDDTTIVAVLLDNTNGFHMTGFFSSDEIELVKPNESEATVDSYNDGAWHHVALTWVDGTPLAPPKILYLAAPYRGKTINETRENIRYAESVAAKLWAQGYYVFCPHMNTAFFDGIVDDQVFLDAGIEFLNRCDALVLAGKWMDSVGCCAELRAAEERHIPVYQWDDDEEKLVPFRIPKEVA